MVALLHVTKLKKHFFNYHFRTSRTTATLDTSTITRTSTSYTTTDTSTTTVTPTRTSTSTSRTTITNTRPTFTSWSYTTTTTQTEVNWTILARSALVLTQQLNPTRTSAVMFSTVKGGGLQIEELETGRLSVEGENERIFGTEDEVEEFPYLASSIEPAPYWN